MASFIDNFFLFTGFIHRFLSWKIFLPLSRMSYAVYLIHVNFVITYGAHSRKPFYVSELSLIITSLGILVIAFILASVATVAVEMPFLNLDKLFFPNHSKTSESKWLSIKISFFFVLLLHLSRLVMALFFKIMKNSCPLTLLKYFV